MQSHQDGGQGIGVELEAERVGREEQDNLIINIISHHKVTLRLGSFLFLGLVLLLMDKSLN